MKSMRWRDNGELAAWVYEPVLLGPGPVRVMVGVHGISRNIDDVAGILLPVVKELGWCLLVPAFTQARFGRYQTLRALPRHARPDLALNRLLLQLWPDVRLQLNLFGFSGGAQFCHRYSLCWGERVASQALVSAGWYTLPSQELAYPLGLGKWPRAMPEPLQFKKYKSIPTLVLVGERDLERQASLRQDPLIDRIQGQNRLQRAQRWLAQWQRFEPTAHWRLQLLAGVGHDLVECATDSDMLAQVSSFLRTEVNHAN